MTAPTHAAVFVPIDVEGGPAIGFVRRSPASSTHGDDVGFPGGKVEPVDGSLRETARRETLEEVALAPDDFEPSTALDPHRTRSGDFEVRPFVGPVFAPGRFVPDSREVAGTFWVGVDDLREGYAMDGDRIRYRVGRGDGEIWGLTARIVTSVLVSRPAALSP